MAIMELDRHPRIIEGQARIEQAQAALAKLDEREKFLKAEVATPKGALSPGHSDALRALAKNGLRSLPGEREQAKKMLANAKAHLATAQAAAGEEIGRMLRFDMPKVVIGDDPEWQARCERESKLGQEIQSLAAKVRAPSPRRANIHAAAAAVARGNVELCEVEFEQTDQSAERAPANLKLQVARRALEELKANEHKDRHDASLRLAEKHGLNKRHEQIVAKAAARLIAASEAIEELINDRDFLQSAGFSVDSVIPNLMWPAPGLAHPSRDQHDILATWLADVKRAYPNIKGT